MVDQDVVSRIIDELKGAVGDEDSARRWLDQENKALGNRRPIDLIQTEEGLQLVLDEINTIRYGNWA